MSDFEARGSGGKRSSSDYVCSRVERCVLRNAESNAVESFPLWSWLLRAIAPCADVPDVLNVANSINEARALKVQISKSPKDPQADASDVSEDVLCILVFFPILSGKIWFRLPRLTFALGSRFCQRRVLILSDGICKLARLLFAASPDAQLRRGSLPRRVKR